MIKPKKIFNLLTCLILVDNGEYKPHWEIAEIKAELAEPPAAPVKRK